MNLTPTLTIPVDRAAELLRNGGSPDLLTVAGKMFGLGQEEQKSVVAGQVPTWAIGVLALGVGLVAGLYVAKQWPSVARRVTG